MTTTTDALSTHPTNSTAAPPPPSTQEKQVSQVATSAMQRHSDASEDSTLPPFTHADAAEECCVCFCGTCLRIVVCLNKAIARCCEKQAPVPHIP